MEVDQPVSCVIAAGAQNSCGGQTEVGLIRNDQGEIRRNCADRTGEGGDINDDCAFAHIGRLFVGPDLRCHGLHTARGVCVGRDEAGTIVRQGDCSSPRRVAILNGKNAVCGFYREKGIEAGDGNRLCLDGIGLKLQRPVAARIRITCRVDGSGNFGTGEGGHDGGGTLASVTIREIAAVDQDVGVITKRISKISKTVGLAVQHSLRCDQSIAEQKEAGSAVTEDVDGGEVGIILRKGFDLGKSALGRVEPQDQHVWCGSDDRVCIFHATINDIEFLATVVRIVVAGCDWIQIAGEIEQIVADHLVCDIHSKRRVKHCARFKREIRNLELLEQRHLSHLLLGRNSLTDGNTLVGWQ